VIEMAAIVVVVDIVAITLMLFIVSLLIYSPISSHLSVVSSVDCLQLSL
jgi:hypothetical protein